MSKKLFLISLLFPLIIVFLFLVLNQSFGADSYRSNRNTTIQADECPKCPSDPTCCRRIRNNSATEDVFVPTLTCGEWSEFKINKPTFIDLSPCCTGNISLSLSPSSVLLSQSVTATASGLSNCDANVVYIRRDSCSGAQQCTCNVSAGSCSCNFTAPSSAGTYTYYACTDKNLNGNYTDPGESAFTTLNVCQCWSGDCCDGCRYRSSSTVCSSWSESQYGCSSTSCGGDVQERTRTCNQYCPGNGSNCAGSTSCGSYSGWYVISDCGSTERCHSSYYYCYWDSSCACSCSSWSSWSNVGCGECGCSSTYMCQRRTRTCTPFGCNTQEETQCVSSSSCTSPPPPTYTQICNNAYGYSCQWLCWNWYGKNCAYISLYESDTLGSTNNWRYWYWTASDPCYYTVRNQSLYNCNTVMSDQGHNCWCGGCAGDRYATSCFCQ